eukprot:5586960-Prymnesium_polylepis.1
MPRAVREGCGSVRLRRAVRAAARSGAARVAGCGVGAFWGGEGAPAQRGIESERTVGKRRRGHAVRAAGLWPDARACEGALAAHAVCERGSVVLLGRRVQVRSRRGATRETWRPRRLVGWRVTIVG